MSKSSMVQVNRVCLKILFINRPQFLVDSNDFKDIINLIAPRIGGVYDEISAKAIVGTLTLICRNGISNYIN